MGEPLALESSDGVVLEAELGTAVGAERAAMVLCHPHPQFGGTMRSLVISTLFSSLPESGVTCLRFNFRGVEASTGAYDEGRSEREDVRAALRALVARTTTPIVLTGWSFGADMGLSVRDDAVAGWLAIAPPLRFAADLEELGSDPRPKHLVLAQHDEFRPPADVLAATASWIMTTSEVVPGASHFFVGRTDHVVSSARTVVDRLTATGSGETEPIR